MTVTGQDQDRNEARLLGGLADERASVRLRAALAIG
ncbi:HEAT repeat domain-containing protein, partial [Streptomyces sp. CAI-78]|nr:HEAT repeat domain-containing protein [Streptomyces sp. CAI-78]